MGPERFQKRLSIINPPVFEPDQDLLTWRKKIASSVDLTSAAAKKGDDKLYRIVSHTLGRQTYDRDLHQVQRGIVDNAQQAPKVNNKQDDQVKAVQEIVELIAQEPPSSVLKRQIDSLNKV